MIRIQGLHKFFNKGRQNEIHVINDISLELPEKGMVAIFGKSGCGKTTLLNVIGGLDSFAAGTLTLDGKDIRHNTDDIRNQYIGYIFQNYNLNKQESCFENVANALRLCGMYDRTQIEERVMAALKNVDMEKYAKRLPDTLSGGQQQRIAIARAIVKNPRIILADEPTGNLDEANTVMIMDLLKAISKDHLVLLVTHEANLVDYYCDTVIELSDGKVKNIRNNTSANGFTARDKNDIYLGELSHDTLQSKGVDVEYYGEVPGEPVKLQIVNHNGKLYIKIHTPRVQILDDTSEVKLRDGIYEEKTLSHGSENIDMSKLPAIQSGATGHLFRFGSSLKSGYAANFTANKRGKRLLKRCLSLFAAIIVLMSAVFGTSISDIMDAKSAYNHNVFYFYTPNGEISQRLNAAVGSEESGIDYLRMMYHFPSGDEVIFFRPGDFETFESTPLSYEFYTNAVYLDITVAKDLPLVAGKKDGIVDHEIVITTKVADALIEKSTVGYIREYDDLLGLVSGSFAVNGKSARIVGIVRSSETAVYLSELAMASYVNQGTASYFQLAAPSFALQEGQAIFVYQEYGDMTTAKIPKVGSTVKIHGRELTVSKILYSADTYRQWCKLNGIQKTEDPYDYFYEIIKKEQPDLSDDKLTSAVEKAYNERYFEYYDYYYLELDQYLKELCVLQPYNPEAWFYTVKNIDTAKYVFTETDEYFKAVCYKEAYGKYPTLDTLLAHYGTLPNLNEEIDRLYKMYEREFEMTNHNGFAFGCGYMVSESDYIALSKQVGETDETARPEYYETVDYVGSYDACYTVIHSTDPAVTKRFLNAEFPDHTTPYSYLPAMITPDDQFNTIIKDNIQSIITSLTTMAVILVVMSICMYFIMRSALMSRIKEIGIYRAIGVSKKNLIFRFTVEALVLATLTVFVGYLCTSAFIAVCIGISPLVKTIFFYPIWMAILIMVILYALCLFCGTLPITLLLRKTPSQILAKYDI